MGLIGGVVILACSGAFKGSGSSTSYSGNSYDSPSRVTTTNRPIPALRKTNTKTTHNLSNTDIHVGPTYGTSHTDVTVDHEPHAVEYEYYTRGDGMRCKRKKTYRYQDKIGVTNRRLLEAVEC